MIRQAISCDICGTEKRQTNHWFVAYEQAGELRVSGWVSRHRLRADAKHLCGQTCLHKLMDEFMAKSIAFRAKPVVEDDPGAPAACSLTGASLISAPAFAEYGEVESSARLIPSSPASSAPAPSRSASRGQTGVVTMPPRPQTEGPAPVSLSPVASESRYTSRSWHAEAWQRERARELRVIEEQSGIDARRRSAAHRAL